MGAAGGHHSLRAVYGRARQPGDAHAVQGLPHAQGDGRRWAAGVEELIRTTGFYRNKAKSIKGAAQMVEADFGGQVPKTMDELLRIPGVARNTANVALGSWYGIAVGVVVDTHVLRLSRRLELTTQTAPEKVEHDLMREIPQTKWIEFSHQMIYHGRQICLARKPRCADCTLERLCNSADKTWTSH